MKRLSSFLLIALLILGAVVLPRMAAAEEHEFKTLGDTFPYASDGPANYGDLCIFVFDKDGVWYRAEADVPAEISETINAMEWNEDYDAQVRELFKDLPVKQVYVLSDYLLPPEALGSLVGMTGQELTDRGFVPTGEYSFGDSASLICLAKGAFEYWVSFEPVEPQIGPNLVEVMAPLAVQNAVFSGNLSYCAWEHDFDPNGSIEYIYIAPPAFPIPEIPVAESPFTTLADVLTAEKGAYSSSLSDRYIIAFELNGAYYRVEAPVPDGIREQLEGIDFFDEEKDAKELALLGPLPVSRVGDISACMPAEEELDALAGMTGQELMDMGFEEGMGYSFWDKAEFYLTKDLFEYHVYFNEKVPEMENYDAVLDEILASLTVEKAEVFGLADVCSDPELIW